MTNRATFLRGLGSATVLFGMQTFASAAVRGKPTIVLVHGALTDAMSWRHVVPLLQRAGHPVVAIENSLDSLASDVANTREILDGIVGPVILVGHSYGGCIITGAALGFGNVKGLVYIAALAPDKGESANDLVASFPKLPSSRDFRAFTKGRIILDPTRFPADFAADVDPVEARILAVSQKSVALKAFVEKPGAPAWRQFPSWYAISTRDRALNPQLEVHLARKIRATTVRIEASHASYISHPREVTSLILDAARQA